MNSVTSAQRRDESCVDDTDGSPPRGLAEDLADRAVRMAAQAKYDVLAAFGEVGPIDCEKKHDPDRCGTEAVRNPVLVVKQAGDADAVDRPDVRQAALNDCHLMAPLAAIASTPEGRALIKNAVTENRNDKGEVVSYTVTLHKRADHWWGPATFSEVKYTVDGLFSAKHADPRAAGDRSEVWPPVFEKAFAQHLGGYSQIDGQGSPARAMEILTGKPAVDIPLGAPPGYSAERLQCDLAAGKPVVLLSRKVFEGDAPAGVVGDHAYQVTGAKLDGGRLVVLLHNPWTDRGPIRHPEPPPVPYDELQRWFAAVDVGRVR